MNNNFQTQTPWGYNDGYSTGFAGGTAFNMPTAAPKMVNPLTEEERNALKTNNAFSLKIEPVEMAKAMCTHKDPQSGKYATVNNPDGTVTCTICHTTFDPNKCVNKDYVQGVVDDFINVLQTTKLLGCDFSSDVIRGVFQMQPFVEKIPQLFDISQSSFNRYQGNTGYGTVANPNMWQLYNGMMSGAPMMQPMMQQPYAQPQSAQYPYMGQPMMQQPMGYQPNMMQMNMVPQAQGNPFYQQQPQAPLNQPQQTVPTQQAATPAANGQSNDGTVNVQAQMTL